MKIESIIYERRNTFEEARAQANEGYQNSVLLAELPAVPHDRSSASIVDTPVFVGHSMAAIGIVASLLGTSHLRVLDVGGALGGHYGFARTTFRDRLTFYWTVVETALYAGYGRRMITTPALRFIEHVDEVAAETFDIAYFSSSLPYISDLDRVLSSPAVRNAEFIFVSRTALCVDEIPFLQTVTYDVGTVRYPGRILAQDDLFGRLAASHELYTSWQNEQHSVDGRAYSAPSMVWRRREAAAGDRQQLSPTSDIAVLSSRHPVQRSPALAGCRCVACRSPDLAFTRQVGDAAIEDGAIVCSQCGARYDWIDGIPYLLRLEERDFLALVEIAGEFGSPNYGLERALPYDGTWGDVLARYDAASDKSLFRSTMDASKRHSIIDRHEQWREMQILSGEVDLSGRTVLVVGAGLGFDTHLILERGARVTAIDLNPQTNGFGRRTTPDARWVGALGRALPFIDGWFDHVFISASLHHVLDVPGTIAEMLRVLKIGGSLFTTNDSYMADNTTADEDAYFWNDHVAVLRGINENRPRLSAFLKPLRDHASALDVEFWTSRAHGVLTEDGSAYETFDQPTRWQLSAVERRFGNSNGGLFMRVTVNAALQFQPFNVGAAIMTPAAIARSIGDKEKAMADIAHVAPDQCLPPPFPGPSGNTKFLLLNGWRWSEAGDAGREAYLRGRWYFRRSQKDTHLAVRVFIPAGFGTDLSNVRVIVDGEQRAVSSTRRGETTALLVPLDEVSTAHPFCAEIVLYQPGETFGGGLFRVLEFRPVAGRSPLSRLWERLSPGRARRVSG